MEREFKHFVSVTRRQRCNERLETEIKLLESLPPPLFAKQMQASKEKAAVCIQKYYRGYRVRSKLRNKRPDIRQERAARIIQFWYRKYLSRSECLGTSKSSTKLSVPVHEPSSEKDIMKMKRVCVVYTES